MSCCTAAHANPQGLGDARHTAIQNRQGRGNGRKTSWQYRASWLLVSLPSGIGIETVRALAATEAHLILTAREFNEGGKSSTWLMYLILVKWISFKWTIHRWAVYATQQKLFYQRPTKSPFSSPMPLSWLYKISSWQKAATNYNSPRTIFRISCSSTSSNPLC